MTLLPSRSERSSIEPSFAEEDSPYSSSRYDRLSHRWPSRREVCGLPLRWIIEIGTVWIEGNRIRPCAEIEQRRCVRANTPYSWCESPCRVNEPATDDTPGSSHGAMRADARELRFASRASESSDWSPASADHTFDDDLLKLGRNFWGYQAST